MTDPALPATSASIAQRDGLLVEAEATVIPTLLALHGRQRQALEGLRVCIAALGETAPAGLVAQEAELAVVLAATETALRGYGFAQVDAEGGGDVAGRAGEGAQGAFINSSTFYGTVIGYQENQAGVVSSWACFNCGLDNPPNTSFCFHCSQRLLQICPECGQNTSMVTSKICGNCGHFFGVAVKRAELRVHFESQKEYLNLLHLQYDKLKSGEKDSGDIAWVVISIVVFGFFCVAVSEGVASKLLVFFVFSGLLALAVSVMKYREEKNINSKIEIGDEIHRIKQSVAEIQQVLDETDLPNIKQL